VEINNSIPNQIQQIFENEKPVKAYSKGDIIYYQGDKANSFYYLKKGRVRVYMTSPDGMEKTLSTAEAGEILGEAAFFDGMPRISFAKAMTNIEIVVIDKNRLLQLIKTSPSLALELLQLQAMRVRQLSTQIDSMTFLQAEGRIAQYILQGMKPIKGKMQLKLTHEEIGNAVGVSRVTVSKILNSFAKKGYVQTEYGRIVVKKADALEKLCI
jgi:CRP/FNR family transcriptional regulator